MKFLFLFIFISVSVGTANANEIDTSTIKEVIDLYKTEGRALFGAEISFTIKTQTLQENDAYTSFTGLDNKPMITFAKLTLENFKGDQMVFLTCHELGHLFGSRDFGSYGPRDVSLAYEAEADYFAGRCLVKYFGTVKQMNIDAARKQANIASNMALARLYGVSIDPGIARISSFIGIDDDYPEPNCRALTVYNGSVDLGRPKCWYNP